MIRTYRKVRKEVKKGSVEDAASSSLVWVDAYNINKKEWDQLSKVTEIPISDLKDYYNESEHPTTFSFENYSLIVFKAVNEDMTVPISLYISKNKTVISLHQKVIPAIHRFTKRVEDQNTTAFTSPTRFVFELIDEIIKDYFSTLDRIEDRISTLEQKIFKRHNRDEVKEIFKIKKSLIYLHKALIANRDVISGIEKQYVKELSSRELKLFRDQYNDIVQLIDMEETYREILTGVLDTYLTASSHNLNKVMKTLTVITAFVMIPTLISGIYGMNFNAMPEIQWKYGYLFALGLMALSVIGMYVFFRKKEWL